MGRVYAFTKTADWLGENPLFRLFDAADEAGKRNVINKLAALIRNQPEEDAEETEEFKYDSNLKAQKKYLDKIQRKKAFDFETISADDTVSFSYNPPESNRNSDFVMGQRIAVAATVANANKMIQKLKLDYPNKWFSGAAMLAILLDRTSDRLFKSPERVQRGRNDPLLWIPFFFFQYMAIIVRIVNNSDFFMPGSDALYVMRMALKEMQKVGSFFLGVASLRNQRALNNHLNADIAFSNTEYESQWNATLHLLAIYNKIDVGSLRWTGDGKFILDPAWGEKTVDFSNKKLLELLLCSLQELTGLTVGVKMRDGVLPVDGRDTADDYFLSVLQTFAYKLLDSDCLIDQKQLANASSEAIQKANIPDFPPVDAVKADIRQKRGLDQSRKEAENAARVLKQMRNGGNGQDVFQFNDAPAPQPDARETVLDNLLDYFEENQDVILKSDAGPQTPTDPRVRRETEKIDSILQTFEGDGF